MKQKKMTCNIIIVDDHPLVRQGMRKVFDSADDIEVVAEAANAEEAIRVISRNNPDVIIALQQISFVKNVSKKSNHIKSRKENKFIEEEIVYPEISLNKKIILNLLMILMVMMKGTKLLKRRHQF